MVGPFNGKDSPEPSQFAGLWGKLATTVDSSRRLRQKAKPPEGLSAVRGLCLVRSAISSPGSRVRIYNVMPLRQANTSYVVTPALTAAFARSVSIERWRTYEIAAGFNQDLAHRLYLWNAAIGQSFHFPLQTVEVALRNVVHHALTNLYGAQWVSEPACRAVLKSKQVEDIIKAERRHYSIHSKVASTPQIVASLSLGFWAAMLHRSYNRTVWGTETAQAFPSLTAGKSIADIGQAVRRIQDLRNRIFHQEPLIGHNLTAEYGDILFVLGAICLETRDWMRAHSSVPVVMRMRPK
ncbi:MAG: hypothetical protein EBR34_10270 [Sphingomonadaceae bacterium]|nr:hypothetical protein [Sphingomonadaceae bacterium]